MFTWRLRVNCTCNIWPGCVYVLPIHLATSDLYVAKTFYVRDLFHNLTLYGPVSRYLSFHRNTPCTGEERTLISLSASRAFAYMYVSSVAAVKRAGVGEKSELFPQ